MFLIFRWCSLIWLIYDHNTAHFTCSDIFLLFMLFYMQKKIDKFLSLKKIGRSFNAEVRNRKDYRNPDFLLHAVRYQDIDQIGSCFSKDVFDPHGYDQSDYYLDIGYYQFFPQFHCFIDLYFLIWVWCSFKCACSLANYENCALTEENYWSLCSKTANLQYFNIRTVISW